MLLPHPEQHGTFLVTTATKERIPWCTLPGIPEILIDNLHMTKNVQQALMIDFSILPEHIHILLETGPKGPSSFMHSFKMQCAKDVKLLFEEHADRRIRATRDERNAKIHFTGWQRGFHDTRIHSEEQLRKAQLYVRNNAFNHALVEKPEDWQWCSLNIGKLVN